jgi:SnoaL-like domain
LGGSLLTGRMPAVTVVLSRSRVTARSQQVHVLITRSPRGVQRCVGSLRSATVLSDRFRAAVESGRIDRARELFHEDATFRSPVVFKPYEGLDQVAKVLRAAERVLGVGANFRYVHQLEDARDRVAILEFETEVDGKRIEGIDKLTFDEQGLITELKVMLRPASALQVVGARMAEEFPRVGLSLPS